MTGVLDRAVPTVAELLAGVDRREPLSTADSKSGTALERVWIGGEPHVLKHLSWAGDWIARATEDRECRPLRVWRSGLLDRLPDCLDPAVVAVGHDPDTGATALLMRDVAAHLVPPGDAPLPVPQHLRFCAHMARLHATLWEWPDPPGPGELTPYRVRFSALSPATGARERAGGGVPAVLEPAWAAMVAAVPTAGRLALALAADPAPLVTALRGTPQSFVHGDWKAGNLGTLPDGRTVLLDWQWPGRAAPLTDLCWYLAVNAARLPVSREETVAAYRAALERCGVDTTGWWDRQLRLALLGAFVQLGWDKSGDELAWWAEAALAGGRELAEVR
jgi:hypothetical protein